MPISQELLKRVILDQHEHQDYPHLYIKRTAESYLEQLHQNKEIIVLSGVRRCGKSVLMEHIRRTSKSENDYYFNFEDERLVNFEAEDFEILHQTLISLYGVQKTFYLDEIQNIPAWELFVRRLYNAGCKIYLTGSNANLFSDELGTRLTGRYIAVKIYPISFAEFSQYDHSLDQRDFSTTGIAQLCKKFSEYLEMGGIPAYLSNKNQNYLHALYDSILYRDIIARYKISNPNPIKKLLFYLASNCSKEMTLSGLLGMINNNGQVIKSNTTISDYCKHLESSFLCFFVNKYDDNIKAQQQAPRKVYFVDHVLAKMIGFRSSEDRGRVLENIVFIELKRRGYEVYYYKGVKECDFVLRSGTQTKQVIQVCVNLDNLDTKQREIAGLVEAMDKFSLSTGLIITEYEEKVEILNVNNKEYTVIIQPAWKWLRIDTAENNPS